MGGIPQLGGFMDAEPSGTAWTTFENGQKEHFVHIITTYFGLTNF